MAGTVQSAPKRAVSITLLCVLLCAGLAGRLLPPASAAPVAAAPVLVGLGPGVQVDWGRGVLSAAASCAADLFAASAEIARLKAERLARMRAEQRLRKALQMLSREPRFHDKVAPAILAQLDPSQAQIAHIEYAATGSVSLRLELPLRAPPPKSPAASPPDSGAAAEGDKSPRPRDDPQ